MEKTPQEMTVSLKEDPQEYLISIMHSVWKNRCIGVIVGLKIPELLCNSEKASISIEEIATKSGCRTSTQLYAVMRVLAQWGIGEELENKHFANNQTMELLRRDKGPSVGHMFAYFASEEHFSALRSLGACVKQGKPAFVLDHGMTHFTYMYDLAKCYDQAKVFEGSSEHKIGSSDRRRELAENYSRAMEYNSFISTFPCKSHVRNVYNVFPWSKCNKLVDVGGGLGCFLASILKLPGCEHIQGYVLDLPNAVQEAKTKIQDLGIPEHRIEFVKQDFSKSFPNDLDLQADTVVFKNTLSMFIDDHNLMRKILSNCCQLFCSKGGRLLIVDYLAPDETNGDATVIRGPNKGLGSIHFLSIFATRLFDKKEWAEHLQDVGKELGYQLEHIYDTLAGGMAMFDLSYTPNYNSDS